ncbi:unnamed protein product [Trichogramma brassicae]|uniref:Retroviral polymerase SH3-like domain-containing protein n=1 Tax=Trichogramma brassicae TaxID=86971 RepID=A0A6H5IBJ8_9HYME|nr:unnamed protein product [Trichogramma brassicae]
MNTSGVLNSSVSQMLSRIDWSSMAENDAVEIIRCTIAGASEASVRSSCMMNGLNVDDDMNKLRDRLMRFEIRARFGDDKAMWDPVQDVASQMPAGTVASNNQAAVEATPLASSPNKLGNNFRQWRNMHNISESSSLMDTVIDGNAERGRCIAENESAESVTESELRDRVDERVHTEQQRALELSNGGHSESVNREEIVNSSEREEQVATNEFERGPAAGATATLWFTQRNTNFFLHSETKETKEKSPKKVNFSDSPDHQETEDELNDQWFSEMKEISLRKEALLQNQLEIAAENQRLMQEMIAEQRNLRAAQEAAQASQEKLRKEQAEATKKLNKISSTLEAILLDSRQQQADKENDPGRFGCVAYAKILTNTKKFGEKAAAAILVGYKSNGFLLWQPNHNRFIISRHVRFNEKITYGDTKENKSIREQNETEVESNEIEEKEKTEENNDQTIFKRLYSKEFVVNSSSAVPHGVKSKVLRQVLSLRPLLSLQNRIIKMMNINDLDPIRPPGLRQVFVANAVTMKYHELSEELAGRELNTRNKSLTLPRQQLTIGQRMNYCIRDRRPDSRQHQPGARDRRIDSTAASAPAAQQPQHSRSTAAAQQHQQHQHSSISTAAAQQRRHSSSRATTAQPLASIEISSAEVACKLYFNLV